MDGCGGVPSVGSCIDSRSVQLNCARPWTPPASNRRPPVVRIVAVMLEDPLPAWVSTSSPVMVRYGSPLIVTLCDRQSLYSMRDDVVTVPRGPAGVVAVNVIVI